MADIRETIVYSEKKLCTNFAYDKLGRKSISATKNDMTNRVTHAISFSMKQDYEYGSYYDGNILDMPINIECLLITKAECQTTSENDIKYMPYYNLCIFILTNPISKKDLDVIRKIKYIKIHISEIEFDEKIKCSDITNEKNKIVISLGSYKDAHQSIKSLFDFLQNQIEGYPEKRIAPFVTELDFYN